jgi:hypothetical protein
MNITQHAIQLALTEWDRRYRDNPEQFMNEAARLLDPNQDEYTYGELAAPYFMSILEDIGVPAKSEVSQNKLAIIQRRLAENSETINLFAAFAAHHKLEKWSADINNDEETEYFHHEQAKYYKKLLAQLVAEQKYMKQLKRDL